MLASWRACRQGRVREVIEELNECQVCGGLRLRMRSCRREIHDAW